MATVTRVRRFGVQELRSILWLTPQGPVHSASEGRIRARPSDAEALESLSGAAANAGAEREDFPLSILATVRYGWLHVPYGDDSIPRPAQPDE